MSSSEKGILTAGGRPTLGTLSTQLATFCAVLYRVTGNGIHNQDRSSVFHYPKGSTCPNLFQPVWMSL